MTTGETTNSVFGTGEPRFDMVGRKLPNYIFDTNEKIRPGLVARLHSYALRKLARSGFEVEEWTCEVYTMDADRKPSERVYTVEFRNECSGMIGVQGIYTANGYPILDHGLCIDEAPS